MSSYYYKGLLLLLLACLGAQSPSLQAVERVDLGILAWREASSIQPNWQATLQVLEQQLEADQLVVHWLNLDQLEAAIAEQQLDFVLTNPGHYVDLSSRYELSPLASLQNPSIHPPQQAIGSVVVTLADRHELNTWQDLRNQRLGAVSTDAFGGFQLIQDAMEQSGFNWQQDLAALRLSGFPMEQLLDWLDLGQVDAIILRSCLLETLAQSEGLDLSRYRVIHSQQTNDYPCRLSSQLYPNWPFLQLGSTSPELARQVSLALLSSHLHEGAVQGDQWTAPLSYRSVYQLFERLRVGPFSQFPRNPVLAFIHEYRHGLVVVALLLLLVFAHHLRASYLVHRRTQELKVSEEAERQKQQELIHLSRFALMGEMAAGLAHELNQPLTSIVNYARGSRNYLRSEASLSAAQHQQMIEAMERIASQGEQAAAIIKNLRSFLRHEEAEWQQLSPSGLLQEAIELMHSLLHSEGIRLESKYEPHLAKIRGNRVQLLQILINLLTNAVDAMQAQPRALRCLHVGCCEAGAFVDIWVADTGQGLDTEVQSRLFMPFVTTKKDGMGLGLSLSRSLAQAHQGELFLTNQSGSGALARLRLPSENQHKDN